MGRKWFTCGVTAVFTSVFMLAIAESGFSSEALKRGGDRKSALPAPGTGPSVAYLLDGRVFVQRAEGGAPRPATAGQNRRWRAGRQAFLNPVSPGGRYRIEKRTAKDDLLSGGPLRDTFKVVRLADGVDMGANIGAHTSMDGDTAVFDGWLDARHFAVWLDGFAPNGSNLTRRVMDVLNQRGGHKRPGARLVRHPEFNGWIGPGWRTAIALKGQGAEFSRGDKVHEIDPGYASDGVISGFNEPDSQPPPIPFLAVTSPVSLATFRLSAARTFPLTLDGKPFRGLSRLSPDFGANPVARRPTVTFSRDGWWALLHKEGNKAEKEPAIEYLVSLKTGVTRQLPGTEAVFL